MYTRRAFLRLAAAGGLVLLGGHRLARAAQSGATQGVPEPHPSLVDAARREGRGLLYATQDPAVTRAVLAEFSRRYGVEMDFVRLSSGPMAQRFSVEAESGRVTADCLIMTDLRFLRDAAGRGWLARLAGLPAVRAWPPEYRADYWVAVALNPEGVAWNTGIERIGVRDWRDLLHPRFRGRMLLVDPRLAPPSLPFFALLLRTYGEAYLRHLGRQQPVLVSSVVPALQQLAAGAAAVLVPALQSPVQALRAQGAPVEIGYPSPTTPSPSLAAIPARAPHPNLARLLLHFSLTTDGQSLLNRGAFSPLPNIPGTLVLPAGLRLVSVDPDEAAALRDRILALLGL